MMLLLLLRKRKKKLFRQSVASLPAPKKTAPPPPPTPSPIPRFFFPGGGNCAFNRPCEIDKTRDVQKIASIHFSGQQTITAREFFLCVTQPLLHWPVLLNPLLIARVHSLFPPVPAPQKDHVSCSSFLKFWQQEIAPFDRVTRLFRLLKQPHCDFIMPGDLVPLLNEILSKWQPTIQTKNNFIKYATARFFYSVNTSRTGRISLREFRWNARLETLLVRICANHRISDRDNYFHTLKFHEIYSAFAELSKEKQIIERLQAFDDYALCPSIVNRLYLCAEIACSDGRLGFAREETMQFEDFVYLYLSHFWKNTRMAAKYWFRCLDIDGDGRLLLPVLGRLYYTQRERLSKISCAGRTWKTVMSLRIVDMLDPQDPQAITLEDFTAPKLEDSAKFFFNALMNAKQFKKDVDEIDTTAYLLQRKRQFC